MSSRYLMRVGAPFNHDDLWFEGERALERLWAEVQIFLESGAKSIRIEKV